MSTYDSASSNAPVNFHGAQAAPASLARPADDDSTAGGLQAADDGPRRLDNLLLRLGDRLNPILVKETRQALKSKQFVITFLATLGAGWLWSLAGVLAQGESIHFAASGGVLFLVYYFILMFSMLVMTPVRAMRSLSVEIEEGTHELLAITTLRPSQIVVGKLGSAAVQMAIYFSALAPCMTFTYLLRGIDLATILYLFFWVLQLSVAMSVIGLSLATASRGRHAQHGLTAAFLVFLVLVFVVCCAGVATQFGELTHFFRRPLFWAINGCAFCVLNSYLWLFLAGATVQLRFAAANRSTLLRVAMLAQHAIFTGWTCWPFLTMVQTAGPGEALAVLSIYLMAICANWHVMGSFLIGESHEVSDRVRRTLPQTFAGRTMFTWFSPGAGTGLAFTLANMLAAFGTAALACRFLEAQTPDGGKIPWPYWRHLLSVGLLCVGYSTFYLGLGNLILRALARIVPPSRMLSLALQIVLILTASGAPVAIEELWIDQPASDFSLLHVGNPIAALSSLAALEARGDPLYLRLTIVVPLAGALLLLLNLPFVIDGLRRTRVSQPARVAEEDAAREALRNPPGPVKTNPWN